jgi:hypothetical protein
MLTKQIGPVTAYRPNPHPSLAPPVLVALATAALAYTGGLSPLAVAGLAIAGGLAGLSLSLALWAQAWCKLTEQGWVVE